MQQVFYSDVSAAARVLLAHPVPERLSCVTKLIRHAEAADVYVCRTGRLHPCWGNGTLAAVAMQNNPGAEPSFDNADYCACFELVLQQLRLHRGRTNL